MADMEKVIKGLECCVKTIEDCECADNCPYESQCWDGTMYLDLMRDALELLKAQEPRVMTLEEVLAWAETPAEKRDPFFFEQKVAGFAIRFARKITIFAVWTKMRVAGLPGPRTNSERKRNGNEL